MLEVRKKLNPLSDYDIEQDRESRMFLSDCSPLDLEVLEVLLFSPLKISIYDLSRSLAISELKLIPIIQKFSSIGLVNYQNHLLYVDKERRKYFEFQMSRFQDDFKPNLDFVKKILRQVPIHLLPTWYSIPRSSNNIFESIINTYLLNPHTYERYLKDLFLLDPLIEKLYQNLLSSASLDIASQELMEKCQLNQTDFEELMIQLEFRFICFTTYRKEGDHWQARISPLYEWQKILFFLRKTQAPIIPKEKVSDQRSHSFKKDLEQQSLPLHWTLFTKERNAKDLGKLLKRVLHGKWVFLDDVIRGGFTGMHWSPLGYNEEEQKWFKSMILDWLFPCGMVDLGIADGRDCFAVTHFGQAFFEE